MKPFILAVDLLLGRDPTARPYTHHNRKLKQEFNDGWKNGPSNFGRPTNNWSMRLKNIASPRNPLELGQGDDVERIRPSNLTRSDHFRENHPFPPSGQTVLLDKFKEVIVMKRIFFLQQERKNTIR